MTVTPVRSAPPSWAPRREAPVRSAPLSEANSRSTRDRSAPRAFNRSRLADFSTARMSPIDWLRTSAPKFAPAIEAPTRLAPVRSATTRACERSAPSSRTNGRRVQRHRTFVSWPMSSHVELYQATQAPPMAQSAARSAAPDRPHYLVGTYASTAALLTVFDMQLDAGETNLLPPLE